MKFFEVFDMLKVDASLQSTFSEVAAIKVAASKLSNCVTIFIESNRLITYKEKKKMLHELERQLFAAGGNTAAFHEVYHLSAQYTPENLWDAYKGSLYGEVEDQSFLSAKILREAKIVFRDNTMELTVYDTFLHKNKSRELKKFLQTVYKERFGFDVNVQFLFEEMPEEKKKENRQKEDSGYLEYVNQNVQSKIQNKTEQHIEADKPEVSETDHRTFAATESTAPKQDAVPEEPKKKEEKPAKKPDKKTVEFRKNSAYGKVFQKRKESNEEPDAALIYGRNFWEDAIPIREVQDEIGEVVLQGKILKTESREIRNEKVIYMFDFTDFTDTIRAKIFLNADQKDEVINRLKEGSFIKIKGMALYDKYDKEVGIGSVVGIREIKNFVKKRTDTAEIKRVELHAHTTYSDMDAVVDPVTLVNTAFAFGHKAVAITDHGVVQAFPVANHAIDIKKLKDEEEIKRAKEFKIIYGMEAYLVDDLEDIVKEERGQKLLCPAVVFDLETTGFSNVHDKIIEIGAVKVVDGEITERFSKFVNPKIPIPPEIEKLTGIKDEMVMNADTIETVLPEFLDFCEGCILVAHNASFDTGFIAVNAERIGRTEQFTSVDTVGMARCLLPELHNFKLDTVAKELGVSLENHHRAVDDAGCTAEIYVKFLKLYQERGILTLKEVNESSEIAPEIIKKMPTYHTILLCKNDVGRINLYRMVSLSHIDYFQRRPRIPKSVLAKYREGLLIGSACEAGELYQSILRGESQDEIRRIADFYDYYEIQPLGNNEFMIADEKLPQISSKEDLIEINKKIVNLGEKDNKLVVATCDMHFLNPEDEVYRRIIMSSKGFKDADNQAPLYFRTTEEMLKEFAYLGQQKAEEVVITNTNKIADSIEKISPVRPDKCAPVIPNSDNILRQICYDKAYSIYGKDLPEQVHDRLEHELNSIIKNGFAVMYIIAQKLVWKSNEDGYLVGSRGSVGSSFVATMSGITEVNPLPPHYYCSECHFSDFDSDIVKKYVASSGCDMPDRACPKCGAMLKKDGHNIPFETFLGFNGDKEPDIDLNFSGEYQSKAHEYTEVIFGEGHTFRAGTIGTVAEKTAFGYVKKYDEEHGISRRTAERERLAAGCTGVRRTTGQHPGGIVVLPHGEEIYSFTPIQRPANDMSSKSITTHFEYHSIDHNLLKLDILGHDDPTMIRVLEDFTGIDAKKIRMDDPKVLALFENTTSLGITPADIGGCDLGSLGLPELGTEFVMQMLRDTKPKSFSDMIRISGLSHGTDVWLNNTQTLIKEGTVTLSEAICTRDDIMTYLIQKGVENGLAFKIMESVRKGKGLSPEFEEAMLAKGVPEWYIWSCKRIQYMFPKAHACAYVMMAFRIAYFKVYYPIAYYAAYFSIRASAFNYELMCLGPERLKMHMAEYKRRMSSSNFEEKLSQKEEDTYNDMKLVQEMYARGFTFKPIDIFTVNAHSFQIVDEKTLHPALSTIDGVGERAAEQIVEAAKDGPFLSREDFRERCHVSGTITDKMASLGMLGDIPETNQISLMDFLLAE